MLAVRVSRAGGLIEIRNVPATGGCVIFGHITQHAIYGIMGWVVFVRKNVSCVYR